MSKKKQHVKDEPSELTKYVKDEFDHSTFSHLGTAGQMWQNKNKVKQ